MNKNNNNVYFRVEATVLFRVALRGCHKNHDVILSVVSLETGG